MAALIGCPAVSLSNPSKTGLTLLRIAELRGHEEVAPRCAIQVRRMSRLAQGQSMAWRETNLELWRLR